MKHNIYKVFILLFSLSTVLGCNELRFGDSLLDRAPENMGTTIDELFSQRITAETVLTKAYTCLPYGIFTSTASNRNGMGLTLLENVTDLSYSGMNSEISGPNNLYYSGALSSDISDKLKGSEIYRYGGEVEYEAIRYAWIYIENVDKVPDMSAAEKNERKAEAQMIIALSYFNILRNVGGVCWLDHSVSVTNLPKCERLTFAQTVDNIVDLIDNAIPFLMWKHPEVDDGRMTSAGALGLKVRVLAFAASPTFNSDVPFHSEADKYTCYGNYDASRWERAEKAGEEFINALTQNGLYSLTKPVDDSFNARRKAFRSGYYDRGGSEVLISTRQGADESIHSLLFSESRYFGPTLEYVNMFPWSDGSEFPDNYDWSVASPAPFFDADGNPTRDPRLYETCAVPGDIYSDGNVAPLHVNHPSFIKCTGFRMMKFVLQSKEDRANRYVHWPYLRLSEVLLTYAEIINETHNGPDPQAYKLVNDVRDRVGLSPLAEGMNHDEFLDAVLKERALELGFEEVRWYDMVRRGLEKDFRKDLHGLKSIGYGDKMRPSSFTYETYELPERYWSKEWDTKWFLSPIPISEINKKYGMTQNPGW